MGGSTGSTWRRGLGLLALLAAGCSSPAPEQQPPPAQPAPVTQEPPPPVQQPPPPVEVCLGDAAAAPEPALMQSSPCLESVLEGDGSLRSRTERRFDAAGRLLSLDTFGPADARGRFERRTLDAAGRLTSRETPEQRELRTLDTCGRPVVIEALGADASTSRFTYDAQGRLTGVTRSFRSPKGAEAQETQALAYDAEGHLLSRETWRSEDERLTLDVVLYDKEARVTEERHSEAGPGSAPHERTRRTVYDASGLVLRITESQPGEQDTTTDYRYDAGGRLLQVERFTHSLGTGSRERRAYDAAGRPTETVTEDLVGEGHAVELTRWSCTYAADGSRVEQYRQGADLTWSHHFDARGLQVSWREDDFRADTFEQGSAEYGREGELLRSESRRTTLSHTWSSVEVHGYDAHGRRTHSDLQSQASGPGGATYAHTEYLRTFDDAGRLLLLEEWDLAGPARVLLLRTEARFGCTAP